MMEGFTLQKSNLLTQTTENSSFFLPTDGNIYDTALCATIIISITELAVSLPLNIYVLWLIVMGARKGVASEFFSLNLCVCEIVICFNVVPNIFNIVFYRNHEESPLYFFIVLVFSMYSISRPFFQCCVCVERYVAVIHPVIFLKYKALRYRIALSVVAWIIILGLSVLSSFIPIRCILYYILLPEYLLVGSVKILCSIAVLMALRKPGPGEKLSVKDEESNRMKKKAFWVIMIILVFMIITYCPIMMLIFVYDSLSDAQRWKSLSAFNYLMVFAGFVHPILYLHRVGKLSFIPCL